MRRHSISLFVAAVASVRAYSTAIRTRAIPWTYSGCYVDNLGSRTLRGNSWFSADSMTVETCQSVCSDSGYPFACLEYASQCFCDVAILPTAGLSDETDCSMACSSNGNEICGGPSQLSIYATSATGSNTNPGVNDFNLLDCYIDSVAKRMQSYWVAIDGVADAMSVSACTASCLASGCSYAGVEYSGECWCDDSL
ncbi:WSC-domain-containing protein [Lentithecium fluviatile CBS 122367]|uniref:WSC-domain-containing protein n=1 Tax=Lentithecium fluviatile CBS 122367 TaxID=1168545 RepID=A0A6G1IKW4_9PLEO|nr:WSC-domain-containing protein [Lentithecium fluviatile CBS 122367]